MYCSGQSNLLPSSPTDAENDKVYQRRVQALSNMARLSYGMAVLGTINAVLGIVIIVSLDESHRVFPLTSGASIWSGVYMIVVGTVGIMTSRTSENLKQDIRRDLKCKFGLFYGLSVGSLSICGISAGYNGGGLSWCATQGCSENGSSLVLVLSCVGMALSVVLFGCGICGMVFFFRYRNIFQMYTPAYRAMLIEKKVENLQSQLNQTGGDQNYGGVQSGFGNGGYTNWSSPPPPAYSEKA
ncbi:uncharacterized protein LOC117342193 isoform X1 [Pecten maximus]|uniref:uncharacterized protein LOC117342193 isoform X1 n=2 Tax=Pecten maximus TaxID=6579 RepID=UPI0014581CA6|nr:uncharacterized protein LOC117342193 isoform X1 [Pecten maximus]